MVLQIKLCNTFFAIESVASLSIRVTAPKTRLRAQTEGSRNWVLKVNVCTVGQQWINMYLALVMQSYQKFLVRLRFLAHLIGQKHLDFAFPLKNSPGRVVWSGCPVMRFLFAAYSVRVAFFPLVLIAHCILNSAADDIRHTLTTILSLKVCVTNSGISQFLMLLIRISSATTWLHIFFNCLFKERGKRTIYVAAHVTEACRDCVTSSLSSKCRGLRGSSLC